MDLKQLGKYEIVKKLGEGGFGAVYLATDVKLKRNVALKALHPQVATDEMLAAYFEREALALARLEHLNIVRVYDYDQIDGVNFIVMEFVEGTNLDRLLKENQSLPLDQIVSVFRQILSALGYAHDHGVIHRDIKPSNIMLNGAGTVKITDFGIAKVAGTAKLTRTGTGAGSLLYMSPEQIKGTNIDNRSDLYSVGVTLYQVVAGKTPFEADSDYEIMTGHLEKVPPTPTQFDPAIPKDLEQLILKSLEKKPEKRFQNAIEMSEALERIITSRDKTAYRPVTTGAKTTITLPPPTKWKKMALIVAAAVVVLGVAGYFLMQGGGKTQVATPTFADSLKTALAHYSEKRYDSAAVVLSSLSKSASGTEAEKLSVSQFLAASRLQTGDVAGAKDLLTSLHTAQPNATFPADKFPTPLISLWNELGKTPTPSVTGSIEITLQNYQPFAPVTVSVDGQSEPYQGEKLRFPDMKNGKHGIRVEGAGMKSVTETVQVTGGPVSKLYSLEKMLTTARGSVVVTVAGDYKMFERVTVSLDGKDVEYKGSPVEFSEVPSGTYDIVVKTRDQGSLTTQVSVQGDKVDKKFTLTLSQSALTVSALADEPDLPAQVYFDGMSSEEDQTPCSKKLMTGPHKIWVEHKGYVAMTKPQYIDLKKDMTIEFSLKKK